MSQTLTPSLRRAAIPSLAIGLALGFFGSASLAGPGTQTEDDVYVGKKRQVQGVTTPGTATPQRRPGAGVCTAARQAAVTPRNTFRTIDRKTP